MHSTFTFPQVLSPEEIERYYQNWDNFLWTKENFYAYREWASLRKEAVLLRWLKRYKPQALLDVGCGSGILTQKASRFIPFVVGLDPALDLLSQVKKVKKLKELVAGTATKLPFRARSFDLILCSEVLEHLSCPQRALQEMHRLLKKDGLLLVTTPHLHCYDGLEGATKLVSRTLKVINFLRRASGKPPLYPYGYNLHLQKKSPSQWKKLFSPLFSLQAMEPIFIFPYIPASFSLLKKWENAFLKKFFSLQEKVEKYLKPIYPFSYLGQLQLYVLAPRPRNTRT